MNEISYQIHQLLLSSQRILLIGHQRPDEDTLGAILSFSLYLKSLGKEVGMYTADPPPAYLFFMPGIDLISNNSGVFSESWDTYVFLDCGSIGNTRLDEKILFGKTVINIDHHISNVGYGKLNLIDTKASSTCEIVYDYFKLLGIAVDRRIATCLLSGILGDTSGFIHSTTGTKTVMIASELIKTGVKIHQIFNFVVRNKTVGGLKLWGEVLSRLKVNDELGIAYTWINDDDFRKFGAQADELDGLANFLNAIVDVGATAVFKISPNRIKASWRTKREDIDLSAFCANFGGGGHRKASGFSIPVTVIERNGELVVL
jgi:phosphoesterase RecJ-like protein